MKLKNYLIAVDLDDTIVAHFSEKDHKSFEKLRELAKDNIIVIATGRPNRSSIDYYNDLELSSPLINYNGAWVHNPKDKNYPVTMISMPKQYIIDFYNDNKDYIYNIFSEVGDDIYLNSFREEVVPFLHMDGGRLHVGKMEEILQEDPAGAIFFADLYHKDQLEKYVEEQFKGDVMIRFWNKGNPLIGEFYNPHITKGIALENIRKYYNIDKDKTITFGDGHNDIDMINFAKYGVAMGNSHPDLIKEAKYHTGSFSENGVYDFLTKLENGEID